MDKISARRGTDRVWTVQLADRDGQPITNTYVGTEPFALTVWAGAGRAPYLMPYSAVSWLSAAAGTIQIRLDNRDTAALDAGFYDLSATMRDGSAVVDCYIASLIIESAAGGLTAPSVYCTVDDCRRECSWILDAVQPDPNVPNNLEPQRADARAWFDSLIQRHWRGGMSLGAEAGLLARRRTGQRNVWLEQQLSAGALMLTPAVVKTNALYALGRGLRDLVGARGRTSYQDLAAYYASLAEQFASGLTAELDTNADGQPDFAIDLGFVDVLRG